MANAFRQSYTRIESEQSIAGVAPTHKAINDAQATPLIWVDLSGKGKPLPATPQDDFAESLSKNSRRNGKRRLTGWRVGATIAMAGAFITLTVNTSIGAYAASRRDASSTSSDIFVELFHGDCAKAGSLNTYAHLLINVVSTLLLSGSNYCMQCLVAPTRADVDAAHAKMTWLDIGVPSIRNLRHISGIRRWLWALLVMSSLPLHLMFNSVFFTSLATNDYNVVFATENFTTGGNFSTANGFNTVYFQPPNFKENLTLIQQDLEASKYERLEKLDCLKAYAVDLQVDRRTLIVISSNTSKHDNGVVLGSGNQEFVTPERWYTLAEGYNPYTWLCGERDSAVLDVKDAYSYGYGPYCYKYADRLIANPDVWAPSDWTPEYCLSEKVEGQCSLMANLVIVWIVVACNVIKMVVMAIVAFSGTLDAPLCTIGDAINSFMTDPDPTTKNMCLVTRSYMVAYEEVGKNGHHYNREMLGGKPELRHFINGSTGWTPPEPQTWKPVVNHRWYRAPSRTRWSWAILFFLACLITTIGLLGRAIGFYQGDKSISALYHLGIGHPNSQTMINGWAISAMSNRAVAIVLAVLVANTPQIVLSFLYFSINGICTCMSLASEWGRFSVKHGMRHGVRTLRTSKPCGKQRSTYFLQLPFRFAIPLIAMSALLHWLISQSIFVAVITIYDELGNLKQEFAVSTCGFSPFAMVLVIITGIVMAGGVATIAYFKLDPGMRTVGSCSAAISASCQLPPATDKERNEIAQGPVVWGDLTASSDEEFLDFNAQPSNDVGHCAFASAADLSWTKRVLQPTDGKRYA